MPGSSGGTTGDGRNRLIFLSLLWVISEEVGGKFNRFERPAAVMAKDYQFEAFVSLHARSLLIAREILCLLYGGSGAFSRRRSLHELTVTALFLNEISHRYLARFPFACLRAAEQLNDHAVRANMTPFTARHGAM